MSAIDMRIYIEKDKKENRARGHRDDASTMAANNSLMCVNSPE